MQFFMVYLLKSVICSTLLFLYYWLFLRYRKYNVYNRFYLLFAVATSLVVPLLHFEWYSISADHTASTFRILQVISSGEVEQGFYTKQSVSYTGLILGTLYTIISLTILCILVAKIVWVYKVKQAGAVKPMDGFNMVYTQSDKAPFSFANNLFWKQSIDINSQEGRRILRHELTHIEQKHTLDKLFMQVVLIVLWINPVYWLIQKELSLVHEFIADEEAIESNDTESFAQMLLQAHYGNVYPDIIHPFFYSPIKRRLIMLTQFRNPNYSYLRRLMVLPVLAASVCFFSFKVNNTLTVNRSPEKIVLVLDAGHGGEDKGASGNNLVEKDANLKITQKLAQLAEAYNIEVIQTRKDDNYIALENRTKLANESSADMLLSIHINKVSAAAKQKAGYELILDSRNARYEESKILASAISSKLNTMDIGTRLLDKGLLVLRDASMPAVLIECGYLDNEKEAALIKNDEQLEKVCRNILSGVVDYQNTVKH